MATSLVSTGVQFPDSTIQTTAAAAGGTISGTASGSIASGNPVLVNTNGTFSAATVALGPVDVGTTSTAITTGTNVYQVTYLPDVGYYLYLTGSGGSNYLTARTAPSTSDGSIAWSGETTVTSDTVNAFLSAKYIGSGRVAACFGSAAGSSGKLCIVSVSSTGVVTAGATLAFGRADDAVDLAWNFTGNIGMYTWVDGGTNNNLIAAFTVAGLVITSGAAVTAATTFGGTPTLGYDQATNTFLLARDRGRSLRAHVCTTTASRVVTVNTEAELTTYASNPVNGKGALFYVPGPNKLCLSIRSAQTSPPYASYPQAMFITITGTTPSLATGITTSSARMLNSYIAWGYDDIAGVIVTQFFSYDTANPSGQAFAINGTTIAYGSVVQLGTASSTTNGNARYIPFNSVSRLVSTVDSTTNVRSTSFKAASSTLTTENFIGFSTASYTNGQTAVVTVAGGKNTAVSGAAVGVKNYVAGTGLTSSVTPIYAGIGLSSTSLLVKG